MQIHARGVNKFCNLSNLRKIEYIQFNHTISHCWKSIETQSQLCTAGFLTAAPEIREFWFRDTAHRTPEYEQFMRNLQSFTMSGKNKHDDAPDSLAGLCDMIHRANRTAVVFARPF